MCDGLAEAPRRIDAIRRASRLPRPGTDEAAPSTPCFHPPLYRPLPTRPLGSPAGGLKRANLTRIGRERKAEACHGRTTSWWDARRTGPSLPVRGSRRPGRVGAPLSPVGRAAPRPTFPVEGAAPRPTFPVEGAAPRPTFPVAHPPATANGAMRVRAERPGPSPRRELSTGERAHARSECTCRRGARRARHRRRPNRPRRPVPHRRCRPTGAKGGRRPSPRRPRQPARTGPRPARATPRRPARPACCYAVPEPFRQPASGRGRGAGRHTVCSTVVDGRGPAVIEGSATRDRRWTRRRWRCSGRG